jgi:bifunctional non-homologous end joining protein LigD
VREFARRIAHEFVKADHKRYTASMSKRARKGKIFIDYLRNAYNATAIAAWSPRSRPGAPVSVPITWDELTAAREPPVFEVPDVPARLARLRRDPWTGFGDVRQSITASLLKEVGAR